MGIVGSSVLSEAQNHELWEQISNYNGKTENFVKIMEHVKENNCESSLGEDFKIWKLACLYAQTAKKNNDLGYAATEIISNFMTEESKIKKLPDGDHKNKLMNCMYLGTRDKKYLKSI